MKTFKRSLAIAAASGILLTGGFAGVATAQVPPTAAVSVIDDSQTGTLHVHKYSNNTPGQAGNGTEITDSGSLGAPLAGAVFKVEQVNDVDLTTNEGWVKAAAIAKGEEQPAGFGPAQSKTTNGSGAADFSGLPVGLYRVTETSAPTGHEITTEPFYVTLPMTNPSDRSQWMYDVHVYPKNAKQEDVISKTVQDAEAIQAGDKINYTVSGKLPSAQKLAKAELIDIYPADRLSSPQVERVTYGDGQVAAPGDYTLNTDIPGQAKIVFTAQGLAKLDALQGANRKVDAVFSFIVELTSGDSEAAPIANRAMINAKGEGDSSPDPDPDDPDNPSVIPPGEGPETFYGNVKVTKTDEDSTPLNGVVFDLYRCNSKDDLVADAIKTGLTTDNGSLTINGLHVNDFVNGEAGTTDPSGYCLVEVKAAEGHSLLAEPAYFQVLRNGQENVALTDLNLTNVKDNAGFDLPLTGGRGVTLLLILGGLIVVIGGGYAYVTNRKKT